VPCLRIGTTGGETIAIAGEGQVEVAALKRGFEAWLPAYMSGASA
jgi:phosphoribosylformylglycinamidine synthase subunit PurL